MSFYVPYQIIFDLHQKVNLEFLRDVFLELPVCVLLQQGTHQEMKQYHHLHKEFL